MSSLSVWLLSHLLLLHGLGLLLSLRGIRTIESLFDGQLLAVVWVVWKGNLLLHVLLHVAHLIVDTALVAVVLVLLLGDGSGETLLDRDGTLLVSAHL